MIFLWIFWGWCIQATAAGIFNFVNGTRIPTSTVDFFKLTFLPYVMFHADDIKREIDENVDG